MFALVCFARSDKLSKSSKIFSRISFFRRAAYIYLVNSLGWNRFRCCKMRLQDAHIIDQCQAS